MLLVVRRQLARQPDAPASRGGSAGRGRAGGVASGGCARVGGGDRPSERRAGSAAMRSISSWSGRLGCLGARRAVPLRINVGRRADHGFHSVFRERIVGEWGGRLVRHRSPRSHGDPTGRAGGTTPPPDAARGCARRVAIAIDRRIPTPGRWALVSALRTDALRLALCCHLVPPSVCDDRSVARSTATSSARLVAAGTWGRTAAGRGPPACTKSARTSDAAC